MATSVLPPRNYLLQLFDYDPETGALHWKPRPETHFAGKRRPAAVIARMWNNRFAGARALHAPNGHGYRYGQIGGKPYRAHRIIWKMVYGTDPVEIDHINHNREDNRIVNLRDVTSAENKRNSSLQKNNTSGAVGVRWSQKNKNWTVHITLRGKTYHLGSFATKEAAVAARTAANRANDFHPNHGILEAEAQDLRELG